MKWLKFITREAQTENVFKYGVFRELQTITIDNFGCPLFFAPHDKLLIPRTKLTAS